MNVKILPEALLDLEKGFFFYERQGIGLGRYFLESLLEDIDSLSGTGGIHRVVYNRHRKLARRFPFAVYYSKTGTDIDVWRVLDCRQDHSGITR
jgi:plasmid stabilization system protein ParE